jgi:4-hydroxybenzoate polyprenyltransferase
MRSNGCFRTAMNLKWLSDRGAGLTAVVVGLGFIAVAFRNIQYRYFYICVAILAMLYAYKQLKKRETPFEKRERELRRRSL